jgi:hypothetical protein
MGKLVQDDVLDVMHESLVKTGMREPDPVLSSEALSHLNRLVANIIFEATPLKLKSSLSFSW